MTARHIAFVFPGQGSQKVGMLAAAHAEFPAVRDTFAEAGEALDAQVGQTTPPSAGGALNPEFVCWLMGYPSEWLNCAPSAMPSSRKSSRKSPAQ